LTKIAVYEALGRIRRAKREEELQDTMNSGENPEHMAYGRELQSAIEAAVDSLPPLYRSVFVLRELEGMTVSDTADCLGITQESVKTRLHRARALLRAHLKHAVGPATQAFTYLGDRCDRMTAEVMQRVHRLQDQTGSSLRS
jgi:RNA polymerase sigma-70 factor (ECF subfamily)